MTLLSSCKQPDATPAVELPLSQQSLINVSYGTDSLQTMDVYLPADRSAEQTKSLILIHGGGWTSGSKAEFFTYIDSFKTRLPDYAIFNINYRLANEGHLFPTQENDIRQAIDFIVSNAKTYQVDPGKFVLLGVSAGAHLALLQAYKQPSPKIQAVIDYFGPTDLLAMYQKPWHPLVPMALQLITGVTPAQNKTLYTSSSPVEFVDSTSPPTLILHGARDEVVDVSQSKTLAKKLDEAGVKHQLKIYPNEQHGRWFGKSLISSFDHIERFLKTNVR